MPDITKVGAPNLPIDPSQSKIENQKSKIDIEDPKLRKATRDLEGYFVGVLMKRMHESASKGGLFEEKSETATYREMFDDAVAAQIGKQGAFGIADTLYRQLVTQRETKR